VIRIEVGVIDQEDPAERSAPAIPDTVDELLRKWPPEERERVRADEVISIVTETGQSTRRSVCRAAIG
jgi:hypothetical protein